MESKDTTNAAHAPLLTTTRKLFISGAWRKTISLGIFAGSVVLTINVTVLGWISARHAFSITGATVFTGSCNLSETIITVIELLINVLSTLLLGASNTCAQLLSAPTRQEVDRAHAEGKWLDIGVPGVRNLFSIKSWRVKLWILLFASSITLHLMYNSVAYTTMAAYNAGTLVVSKDFLTGGSWTHSELPNNDLDLYHQLQNNATGLPLQELSIIDCVKAYQQKYIWQWRNPVVVIDVDGVNNTVLIVYSHGDDYALPNVNYTLDMLYCQSNGLHCGDDTSIGGSYCLAEQSQGLCTVSFSGTILAIVVACNIVKLSCLIATAFALDFEPLATVGDAVASFLDRPDAVTAGVGPLSSHKARQSESNSQGMLMKMGHAPWRAKKRRWGQAVSVRRWVFCIALCMAVWLGGLTLFIIGQRPPGAEFMNISAIWTSGLGSAIAGESASARSLVVGGNVFTPLLANAIAVSLVYLFYNSVFTSMLLAHEYSSFARTRKPLRTSNPVGSQKSSYWLQLPYRYIVPIMTAMAVLHWMIGRSLFLVQINKYNQWGARYDGTNAIGYSLLAIIFALVVGGMLIVGIVAMSCRTLASGMPLAASCSLAISAACHPNAGDEDAALKSIMYGVETDGQLDEKGCRHAAFSSRKVEHLADGVTYA
ncbi:hypothetical protein LTR35_017683 [Friedmanniomyces endolithicus]|nr:hypothetical protein LTR35_017683 [Friedmanniomyces endolithicus]KAK0268685.1 hypothetical protein LTS00_017504 [Friedmanniomyces endolithicus]